MRLKDNPETFENAVATLVDVASILFAYQIGVYGFGIGFGFLYAGFDAFIVIWMRKPISRFARSISPFRFKPDARQGGEVNGNEGAQSQSVGSSADGPVAAVRKHQA